MRALRTSCVLSFLLLFAPRANPQEDLTDWVEHGFAENDGVKIHYVTLGEGPLVVMIHGFPDYWYTWRHQMAALSEDFQVVAIDQRGYNKSGAPEGVGQYAMPLLMSDVVAVIRETGHDKATIVGHDWGAAVAWQIAMNLPEMTERLVILSVPHPSGFGRELATNEDQQRDSQYARDFQKEDSHESLTAEGLAAWVSDGAARVKYIEAFRRSSFAAMMNYYRANYPRVGAATSVAPAPAATASWPKIRCPVLVIHGLQDRALNARGHGNTWEWVEKDMTILMIPDAGHFVQHEAAELVTKTMSDWLAARR